MIVATFSASPLPTSAHSDFGPVRTPVQLRWQRPSRVFAACVSHVELTCLQRINNLVLQYVSDPALRAQAEERLRRNYRPHSWDCRAGKIPISTIAFRASSNASFHCEAVDLFPRSVQVLRKSGRKVMLKLFYLSSKTRTLPPGKCFSKNKI